MMKKLRIVKIPLETDTFKRPRQKFPRMRRMYLEIIENKDKIQQEFFDLEYDDAKYSNNQPEEEPQTPPPPSIKRTIDFGTNSEKKKKPQPQSQTPTPPVNKSYTPQSDIRAEHSPSPVASVPRRAKVKEEEELDLDRHLDELLRASKEKKPKDKYKQQKFDVSPSNFNSYEDKEEAPSLSELRRRGHDIPKQYRNAGNFSESEEDKKRELLLKIRMLRKYYPESDLPEFSAYSSYAELKNSYDDTFRSLSIDTQVNSYERYIIIFSYGLEIVAGRFLKFDMQGFTKHQLSNMAEYKRLLIELGEKSYSPNGSSFPIEIRLLFICLQQMALFLLMKSTGVNGLMTMLSSLGNNSQKPAPTGQSRMAPPKI